MIKLNIGAGGTDIAGYIPVDRKNGQEAYPLSYADNSVDEIRASHVLEHFSHREVEHVVKDWVRALKPGGTIRVAVPDFAKISQGYLAGVNMPTEGYVMGGQVDADDFHRSVFDAQRLKRLMAGAGLMLIRDWKSTEPDCAALPISLNLEGTKPHEDEMKVSACMSVPRLGFMDNFMCAFEALPPLKVVLRRHTGAFWGQCLERCIEEALEQDSPDAILTLDYDTVFSRRDASLLMQLMMTHPEADAIAPVQVGRNAGALMALYGEDLEENSTVSSEFFAGDLARIGTAHFGLTLLRAEKFRTLPKPWFQSKPAPDNTWGEGRRDDDIAFWDKWRASGNSLYLANRVSVGHMELMVRWPGQDLQAIHQSVADWRANGPSKERWS